MSSILENIATALLAVADVPVEASIFPTLSDDDLVLVQAKLAELRRLVDARAAAAAADIAYRSRRELGYGGLAQRRGHRTADALIQSVTRSTRQDASALVRAGAALRETQGGEADSPRPWLGDIGEAIARGDLSLAASDAIRAGLGAPSDRVDAGSLREAIRVLLTSAQTLDADVLFTKARALRDELDAAGIADREAECRARRYLRLTPLADGMVRLTGLLDPESAALVMEP
ncbi:MAG: endonuclease [Microbacteriaceae bacterium]|nr:endonuclease [Microbacteriaceae bacterium]